MKQHWQYTWDAVKSISATKFSLIFTPPMLGHRQQRSPVQQRDDLCSSDSVFCCPCDHKIALKTKTDGWGWCWTEILWLLSAPEGTIRRGSALQSIASLTNGCFLISYYGIIGVVGERQQPYFLLKWPALIQNYPPGLENNKAANEFLVNILTFHWQRGLVFQRPGAKQPDLQ